MDRRLYRVTSCQIKPQLILNTARSHHISSMVPCLNEACILYHLQVLGWIIYFIYFLCTILLMETFCLLSCYISIFIASIKWYLTATTKSRPKTKKNIIMKTTQKCCQIPHELLVLHCVVLYSVLYCKCGEYHKRRPASADRTARRQFQATGQLVSRTQASDAMTSRLQRYEPKCAQRRCFQCGSVPLRSDIKKTELPPANILMPLERQLIALQLCRWEFFYIMKLCSILFVLYCRNCPKDDKFRYFIPILRKLGAA